MLRGSELLYRNISLSRRTDQYTNTDQLELHYYHADSKSDQNKEKGYELLAVGLSL